MPDARLSDAVENIRKRLYMLNQQLRLLAQLTIHEVHSPVTIQSETFSVAMNYLAEQVWEAAREVEMLLYFNGEVSSE